MPSSLSQFNSAINTCRDILRKEGITGMDSMKHLTLYILARALDSKECKRLKISETFAWEKFKERMVIDSKRQECFDLLYNKNGGDLISYLDDIFGTRNFNFKLRSPDNHISILKILDTINLKELEGSIDILGTVYENHLGSGSNKSAMRDLGQFFTDRRVCTYMTQLCGPKSFSDGRAESVLDPTMGTGGFLTAYFKFLKDHGATINWQKMHMDVAGYDIDEFVMSIGRINMYLSTGVIFERITHRDTLQNDVGEPHQRLKFKLILANMPFGVKGLKFADCCKRVKELKCDGTKSEPLFLNLMMAALDDGGRCAVVVPDGVLVNNSNQHNSTRKYLLDHFALKRVIKMKGQFFSNTGIQPSILFFENTGTPTQSVEFWEVEQGSNGTIAETMVLAVPREKFDDACSIDMRRYQEVKVVANPAGFTMVKLGDIAELCRNNTEIVDDANGMYTKYFGPKIVGKCSNYHFDGEYILTPGRQSIGLLGYVNGKFTTTHTFVIKVKPEHNSKYVYYYLLLNDKLSEKSKGIIPYIKNEDVLTLQVIVPPLETQQEIVTALDLIYNNAATSKATAESVKSQMAAVMRSVGARGFERKHIKDVLNVVSGKSNQDREAGRPVPYYDSNGVIGYVAEPLYTGEYTITARNLSIGAVHYINGPFYPSDHTINFTSLDQNVMNNRFFYNWLHLNNQVLKELSSGIKPGIRKSDVAEILMPVPQIEFQHEVLAILNEMEAELAMLEQMVAKAEQRAKFILDGYLTPTTQADEFTYNENGEIIFEE
jgi:type I restriction-modification system DNA methylase subunit/restriction endonuclease S subunit